MKFHYRRQPNFADPRNPWISRPEIPVRLFYQDRSVDLYALVDSGAEITLFDASIARVLGIDLAAGRQGRAAGVSGPRIAVSYHRIQLQVIGMREVLEAAVGFAELPTVAAILGRAGFFEHYRITFDHAKELIELRPKKA